MFKKILFYSSSYGMPSLKGFQLRLEVLDQCLRTSGRQWTLDQLLTAVNSTLSDRLGMWTSKRTLQNDIRYLKEQKFAPIKRVRRNGTNLFYYEEPFSIQQMPISTEEVSYLRDAIKLLKQVNDFSIIADVEAIVLKLENTVKANVPGQAVYIQFEKYASVQGNNFIDPLFVAIRAKLCVRIAYQPFQSKKSHVSIYHPYLLKEYRNRWFLFCRENNATRVTTLALDRIQYIKNSNEPFIENNLFDPHTYFENIIGVTIPAQASVYTIELKVATSQAAYILAKPIHSSQEIVKKYNNGSILLRFQLMENFELIMLLLSFGPHIEVKKPLHLRQLIGDRLKGAAGLYSRHKPSSNSKSR